LEDLDLDPDANMRCLMSDYSVSNMREIEFFEWLVKLDECQPAKHDTLLNWRKKDFIAWWVLARALRGEDAPSSLRKEFCFVLSHEKGRDKQRQAETSRRITCQRRIVRPLQASYLEQDKTLPKLFPRLHQHPFST